MQEVDIVLRWVDPTDDDWIKEKRKYSGSQDNKKNSVSDSTDVRYRDWDLLRFWFRCVENNAPWVRKIFFVTYGHIPKWLKMKNLELLSIMNLYHKNGFLRFLREQLILISTELKICLSVMFFLMMTCM